VVRQRARDADDADVRQRGGAGHRGGGGLRARPQGSPQRERPPGAYPLMPGYS